MNAHDIIQITREAISDAEKRGVTAISPESLNQLLSNLEKAIDPHPSADCGPDVRVERYKAELEIWVAQFQHSHSIQVEMFRAVVMAGQSAMQSVVLINGGAAVALLAFLGHAISTKASAVFVQPIANALYLFVIGVLYGSLAMGSTYVSQSLYAIDINRRGPLAILFHALTVLLTVLAYVWFFRGACHAISGFHTYAT